MSKKILEFTKDINNMIQQDLATVPALNELCTMTVSCIQADVVILDLEGRLVTESRLREDGFAFNTRQMENGRYIDSQLNDQFRNIVESSENVNLNNFYIKNIAKTELKKYVAAIFPLSLATVRLGTLVFMKEGMALSTEELCVAEITNVVATLIMSYSKNQEDAEVSRKLSVVKSALSTLSYSELDAIVHIFGELDSSEGLLVASKVADRVGITRSVIVNALRKFESAGVIETRSLGMKGTYIKVLNDSLITELNKLQV